MEFKEVLMNRFSCRGFKEDPIEEEKLDEILHAAQYGPSGRNLRPYRFVVCLSEEARAKVYDGLPFGRYKVPAVILVVGDTKKSENLWYQDCAVAAENILLSATSLGLGSLWCAVHPYADRLRNINEVANVKEGETVFCAILLGYPADGVARKPKQFEEDKITRV